jgi:hypothetical protein
MDNVVSITKNKDFGEADMLRRRLLEEDTPFVHQGVFIVPLIGDHYIELKDVVSLDYEETNTIEELVDEFVRVAVPKFGLTPFNHTCFTLTAGLIGALVGHSKTKVMKGDTSAPFSITLAKQDDDSFVLVLDTELYALHDTPVSRLIKFSPVVLKPIQETTRE